MFIPQEQRVGKTKTSISTLRVFPSVSKGEEPTLQKQLILSRLFEEDCLNALEISVRSGNFFKFLTDK